MRIQPDRFNAHSLWTQPMRIECAFDVQCGQAFRYSIHAYEHVGPTIEVTNYHKNRNSCLKKKFIKITSIDIMGLGKQLIFY